MTAIEPRPTTLEQSAISALCDRVSPTRHDQDAVDLMALARSLGIIDVVYKASRIHGYTKWSEHGARVFLAMARTEGRRRATLAHEMAHVVLNPAFTDDASIDSRSRVRSIALVRPDLDRLRDAVKREGIERVCDRIAFELLLPDARARTLDSRALSDVNVFIACASRLHISLALLANQVSHAGVQVQLVRLARAWDGGWVTVDVAGLRRDWELGIKADRSTSEVLDALPTDNRAVKVELRTANANVPSTFSVARRGSMVVAVRAR